MTTPHLDELANSGAEALVVLRVVRRIRFLVPVRLAEGDLLAKLLAALSRLVYGFKSLGEIFVKYSPSTHNFCELGTNYFSHFFKIFNLPVNPCSGSRSKLGQTLGSRSKNTKY